MQLQGTGIAQGLHRIPFGPDRQCRALGRLFRSLCLAAALPDLALRVSCASPCEPALCFAAAANVPGQTPLPNVAAILPSQTPNPSLPTSSNNAALGAQTLPYLSFGFSATCLHFLAFLSASLQGKAKLVHEPFMSGLRHSLNPCMMYVLTNSFQQDVASLA